jgi:signal transduction histidine kinase
MRDAHRAGMKRYAETREKRVLDQGLVQLEAVNSDGQIFPVEPSISTAKTDGGEIYVSYIRDISKRVAAQNELVDARDKAVAGEKAKANLLAVMSHEMRTPLNGLIGSLQLLDGTSLSDRQKKFVDVMKTSGQMLLEHVNNVLDISRVDAGKVEKFEQNFDVPEAVNEVVESLKSTASERGNTLSFEVTRDDIGTAFGDKARLTQILVNLIGNALKFTENGRVQVEVERDPNSDVVEFRVIDNGIGIPEDQRQQIFEDFVTLDSSFTRAVEGTGLGLGIVRRLVAILDGEIGVESEAGEGSVFWVRLPLKPVSLKPKTTKQTGDTLTKAVDQSGASFLIIEDNEINRLVAREMLAQMGYISFEANDGQEGVEAADRQAFDLIFLRYKHAAHGWN